MRRGDRNWQDAGHTSVSFLNSTPVQNVLGGFRQKIGGVQGGVLTFNPAKGSNKA
jgi:hypothetical protein